MISNKAGRRYPTINSRIYSDHTTPSVVNKMPTEKVLKAPLPYSSGLKMRIAAIPIAQNPKRTKQSESISDMLTSRPAAKAAAHTARIMIKIPSERTPTGFFGMEFSNISCFMKGYKSFRW